MNPMNPSLKETLRQVNLDEFLPPIAEYLRIKRGRHVVPLRVVRSSTNMLLFRNS